MIAIALVLQPHFVRLTRCRGDGRKSKDYVTASRLAGAGPLRLMFRHLAELFCTLIVRQRSPSRTPFSTQPLSASSAWARNRLREWGTMLAEAR